MPLGKRMHFFLPDTFVIFDFGVQIIGKCTREHPYGEGWG